MSSASGSSWDFYFFVVDGRPCSTMLDLGLADHAPDRERPWLVSIRIPLRDPRPDGLTTNAEASALGHLEDALVRSLGAHCGAIFVGRMTWNGVRDLFFYCKRTEAIEQALGDALEGTEPRRLLTRKQNDAAWKHYLEVLYPGPLERQWMKDRRVVEALAKEGDKSDIARPIDHYAVFPTRQAAEAWANAVRPMGFEVVVERSDGVAASWGATAVRDDPAELAHVHEIAERLYGLADAHGGKYDGWGCEVVRGHDA